MLAQAGALLINHIALGRRTLSPFTCGANASRRDAMAAEITSDGWLRSQLLTADLHRLNHSLLQPAAGSDVQICVELLEALEARP
jgi:hypothetical protein